MAAQFSYFTTSDDLREIVKQVDANTHFQYLRSKTLLIKVQKFVSKSFIQQVEELQKSQMHGLKDKNNPFVILRWYHYASHRLKGNIRL